MNAVSGPTTRFCAFQMKGNAQGASGYANFGRSHIVYVELGAKCM